MFVEARLSVTSLWERQRQVRFRRVISGGLVVYLGSVFEVCPRVGIPPIKVFLFSCGQTTGIIQQELYVV